MTTQMTKKKKKILTRAVFEKIVDDCSSTNQFGDGCTNYNTVVEKINKFFGVKK